MSADVWLVIPAHLTGGEEAQLDGTSANVTYNLSGLLLACGFPGHSTMVGMRAREAGKVYAAVAENIKIGLIDLIAEADGSVGAARRRERRAYLETLLPENGWGDAESAFEFCTRMAASCERHPHAEIGAWL